MNQGERIIAMEVRLHELEKRVHNMDDKLDQLLALRYKGAGAFWLASALFGTGIIGVFTNFFHFWRT